MMEENVAVNTLCDDIYSNKHYHHQLPPYGKLGKPYIITKNNILYPSENEEYLTSKSRWSYVKKVKFCYMYCSDI